MNLLTSQLANPSGIFGPLLGWLWNRRNAALNEAALSHLNLHAQERVLEIGFGGGNLLRRMSRIVDAGCITGVDHSYAIIRTTARRLRRWVTTRKLGLAGGSAEALPFTPSAFSRVVSVNSIFYWSDARRAFSEVRRVLAKGGLFVLVFTERESLRKRGFSEEKMGLYRPEQVAAWLNAAGFVKVNITSGSDRHRKFWIIQAQ